MTNRSWTKVLATGICLALAAGVARGDGGKHPRTTSRLLATFEGLRTTEDGADRGADEQQEEPTSQTELPQGHAVATFGTGCFWCTEAVFEQLRGVQRVVSGYSGGYLPNPTYEQVCTGATGHAEVVQIEYDPQQINFAKLLEVFYISHDPTTLNRQGVDVGTQYRSAIFYHDDEQRKLAEHYKEKLNESKAYRNPIVTQITKFNAFYPAKNYHQDYFALNGRLPYCRTVIRPKVQVVRRVFREDLKPRD